jgi:Holliday junction resolvasome RuvABC endonuclease subunit
LVEEAMAPVLGLDTDSKKFTYAATFMIPDLTGDTDNEESFGWWGASAEVEARRAVIYQGAKRLFGVLPDGVHVFCEEPLALQNGKTTRLLALAAGVVWAAFQEVQPNAWWHWVDVSSWKKNVIGQGNAAKPVVAEWIRRSGDFKTVRARYDQAGTLDFFEDYFIQTPDLYDAWALKIYGARMVPRLEEIQANDS